MAHDHLDQGGEGEESCFDVFFFSFFFSWLLKAGGLNKKKSKISSEATAGVYWTFFLLFFFIILFQRYLYLCRFWKCSIIARSRLIITRKAVKKYQHRHNITTRPEKGTWILIGARGGAWNMQTSRFRDSKSACESRFLGRRKVHDMIQVLHTTDLGYESRDLRVNTSHGKG